jgi:hypothetical protein
MTPDEHQLIIEMFKQQAVLYTGLLQVLKSRDILDRSDLQAFDALVSASSREALDQYVEAEYLSNAKILGVTTGLPREDGF